MGGEGLFDDQNLILIGSVAGFVVLVLVGFLVLLGKFYRKVDQGTALIVNKMTAEPIVTFTGALVLPVVHRAEYMDISVKTIDIDRRGADGLICKDNVRADIKVAFFVRVNKTQEDVLKVAQSIGCARASKHAALEELFTAKFSEALKTVGKRLEFEELYKERESFRDQIIEVIGKDLNGFVLEDAAIDYLEQTPLKDHDPKNILDAQGIRKITELTAAQNVLTNDHQQNERKIITKQNVEAEEAILELQRQEADAKAKQGREIATMQAREQAETLRVQAEERRKAELARIKSDEEIAIADENKQRQVEVAQWGRQRVVAVEGERVEKEKGLEIIAREREVELQRIEKEKAIEVEKKAIADVVRTRVAVDRTVAEEEERIKDLRAVSEATRNKDVVRIMAEAEAQEQLVKMLKAAEAQEEAAKFHARQKIVEADATLEASDKHAKAKIRLADGVKAEEAAKGLAEVTVKEANAQAIEKEGLAQARVTLETMQAQAAGEERQGLARVKVREAEAGAIEKQGQAEAVATREKLLAEAAGAERKGQAEAVATREKLLAEAAGAEQQGLAQARVKEADAVAVEKQGQAEATATREKLLAEAAGLHEKAAALKAMEGTAREHEEFRIRLEADKEIELSRIRVAKDVAGHQAEVMGKALGNAKVQLVGGDGQFFDRFIKAVSVGQSIDGFVDSSQTARQVLKDYLAGDSSLSQDLKEILSRPALSAGEIQSLTLSAVLGKLMVAATPDQQSRLQGLIEKVQELGLGELRAG